MSSVISGLNIKNIAEYDDAQSYEKYDIVDYQLNSSRSVYPSYTGLGVKSLYFWFNNDYYENFKTDLNSRITGWVSQKNSSFILSQSLYEDDYKKPYISFDTPYVTLSEDQFLYFTGEDLSFKTIFVCFKASDVGGNLVQNILQFDNPNATSESGFLKISGNNSYGAAKIFIDDQQRNAIAPIYDNLNIITLTQTTGSSGPYVDVQVRQNGYNLGEYNDLYSGWISGYFSIGKNNAKNSNLDYYDLFCFSGALSEAQIEYYEKYLFEKYSESAGLYFAIDNVPASALYSPTTYTGASYWTRDVNDLFSLSYGSRADFSSKLSLNNFGDGYKTNIVGTINNLNSRFTLRYDGLTDKQAKCLIAYFENSPEAPKKSLYEDYRGVNVDLFSPYSTGQELYFLDIQHDSIYSDLNKISIEAESLYQSILDYRGMFVKLDGVNIRTYRDDLLNFSYNDVVYLENNSFSNRGYYFYTGSYTSRLAPENSPTGNNSLFTKNFYFKPDIGYSVPSKLRVLEKDYKNSAKQFIKDGLNYNLLELDLVFSNRSNKEAAALLKFLDDKAGYKIFDYELPQPYNKTIQVYCPEWNHEYNFYNSNTINVKFIEFKLKGTANVSFNTKITFIS